MNSTTLFSMALGLQSPWQVNDISFSDDGTTRKELHLHIGFDRGSRFHDQTGAACPVHDAVTREWQHLVKRQIIQRSLFAQSKHPRE